MRRSTILIIVLGGFLFMGWRNGTAWIQFRAEINQMKEQISALESRISAIEKK